MLEVVDQGFLLAEARTRTEHRNKETKKQTKKQTNRQANKQENKCLSPDGRRRCLCIAIYCEVLTVVILPVLTTHHFRHTGPPRVWGGGGLRKSCTGNRNIRRRQRYSTTTSHISQIVPRDYPPRWTCNSTTAVFTAIIINWAKANLPTTITGGKTQYSPFPWTWREPRTSAYICSFFFFACIFESEFEITICTDRPPTHPPYGGAPFTFGTL